VAKLNHTAAAVLGYLQRDPMTGWQIAQIVEVSLCDFFNVTRSQIYRELHSLAEAGLVEAGEVGTREQRPYTITATGHRAFRDWLEEDPGPDIMRSPFFLKLSFADHLDQGTVERYIDQHRQRNEARLAYYRDLQPSVEAHSPNAAHVLRAGIAYREATLRWLDSLPPAREASSSVGRQGGTHE
jgi:DNA-binding PadR family transcriptional regulator